MSVTYPLIYYPQTSLLGIPPSPFAIVTPNNTITLFSIFLPLKKWKRKIIKGQHPLYHTQRSVCFLAVFIYPMQRIMTISYQNRQSHGARLFQYDLPPTEKLVIANRFLKTLTGFAIGDKVSVSYSSGKIIINKLT